MFLNANAPVSAVSIQDTFNPQDYVLSKDKQEWQRASIFTRLGRKVVDCFNGDKKWVRAAHMMDTYCRSCLENQPIIATHRYQNAIAVSEHIRTHLANHKHAAKPTLAQARASMQRQVVALKVRTPVTKIHYQATSPEFENKVRAALKTPQHFWCVDYHKGEQPEDTDSKASTPWFNANWPKIARRVGETEGLEKLLLENPAHLEDFICWVLRDKCPVDVFAGFPAIVDTLKPTYVAGRIGRASEFNQQHHLKIQRTVDKCYVTLPVEVEKGIYQRVPLLPQGEIQLTNGIKTTTKELAKALIRRFDDYVPPLQFTAKGLGVFNTHQVAAAAADPSISALERIQAANHTEWWSKIPPYEEIPLIEAQRRCKGLDGTQPGMILHGAVGREESDVLNNHGYIEVLIPNAEGTKYKMYGFGRTAQAAPHGTLQEVTFLTKTVAGRICCCPDQNEELTNRQNWGVGFALEAGDLDTLQKTIYDYVQRGLQQRKAKPGWLARLQQHLKPKPAAELEKPEKELLFSLLAKNCHGFVYHVAKKVMQNRGEECLKELEELMVLKWDDPFFQGSSHPLIDKLIHYCKKDPADAARIQKKLQKVLKFLGAKRAYKSSQGDKCSVIKSKRLFQKGGGYAPPKIRHLVLEQKKPIHVLGNRAYCNDGWGVLRTLGEKRAEALAE